MSSVGGDRDASLLECTFSPSTLSSSPHTHAHPHNHTTAATAAAQDARRARGEIIPEELTPDEIARFERDARKHAHAPMEVPPVEAVLIFMFLGAVAAVWQWSRRSLQKDAKRQ